MARADPVEAAICEGKTLGIGNDDIDTARAQAVGEKLRVAPRGPLFGGAIVEPGEIPGDICSLRFGDEFLESAPAAILAYAWIARTGGGCSSRSRLDIPLEIRDLTNGKIAKRPIETSRFDQLKPREMTSDC